MLHRIEENGPVAAGKEYRVHACSFVGQSTGRQADREQEQIGVGDNDRVWVYVASEGAATSMFVNIATRQRGNVGTPVGQF